MGKSVDSGIIRSRENSHVKLARALRSKKTREQTGLALLEGVRLVEDALMAGVRFETLLYSSVLEKKPGGTTLLDKASRNCGKVLQVDRAVFEAISDTETSQGIIALAPIKTARLDEVFDAASRNKGFLLMLEGVQDPGNVGTIVRTAAAFSVSGVIVGPGTADPFSPKCLRASMGGVFRVPIVIAEAWSSCLSLAKSAGRLLVADTDPSAAAAWEHDFTGTVSLVLANEGAGPSAETIQAADAIVIIPMPGKTESLNVAACAAILAYEAMRQRLEPLSGDKPGRSLGNGG